MCSARPTTKFTKSAATRRRSAVLLRLDSPVTASIESRYGVRPTFAGASLLRPAKPDATCPNWAIA